MLNHRKYSSGFTNASSRFASVLLILFVIMASVFCGTLITSLAQGEDPDPVRCLHKVKVEDKSYCFFAEKNVVLTPAEIAAKETGEPLTDEELTALILEKAGVYMKEPNCTDSSHSKITVEDWTKKGSFSLSKTDLAALRGASPQDGAPVKLYIDPLISTEKVTKPSSTSVISTTAAFAPAEAAGEPAEPAGGSAEPDSGSTDPDGGSTNPDGGSTNPDGGSTNPDGGSTNPDGGSTDPDGGSTDPDGGSTNPDGGSTDPDGGSTNPDGGSTDPSVDPVPVPVPVPVPEEITWYSVSSLTSPSLLFVVVATEKDSKYVEEICEAKKEEPEPEAVEQPQVAAPVKKPKVPKAPPAPEETLPEFKTIKMYDRSGGPLEETLKDGDPVTLEWIAPKGNTSGKKSFLDHIPGGALGLAAIAAAGALIAFAIVKKKKKSSEEE